MEKKILKPWSYGTGMAVHAKHLDTAEVAYAAIQESDKVYYIQYIKELPLKEATVSYAILCLYGIRAPVICSFFA